MQISNEKILVLAPHTDDAEFGCGGTINKLLEQNCDIFVTAFSLAEESVPSGFPKEINMQYMIDSLLNLGVKKENISFEKFPVRCFPENRQAILDKLVYLNREIKPSLVFLPSTFDTHQDHQVISQEGFRAFKKTSIWGYELPWNNLSFTTNCFIKLDIQHLVKKLESLKFYLTQLQRDYINSEFITSLARTRGGQMGYTYAEAFQIIRANYN